jgi:glycosyltransferase involved in cell wall biosynthesis
MRVLFSAYACEPGAGSEGGHGWNYPSALAKRGHEVHAIVPARWRDGVRSELVRTPIHDLTFHFVSEREWPMRLGWTLGSALRYFLWQRDASTAALKLDVAHDFEIVHHISYGTLLGGSYMWRLGKPFVFGPTGGGQTTPPAFLSYFGRFRRFEVLRTVATTYLWRLDRPAIKAVRSAAVVLASNRETALLARRMGARRVQAMLDVCLPDEVVAPTPATREPRVPARLLWVGRLLARKGQQLTVEALADVPASVPVGLEIIGDGPVETEFRDWLEATNLVHPVRLRGRLSWSEVHRAYEQADVFILTSLRDTVGIQLLEAMAHALPVITLDHQGAADLVPDDAGIKVPVTSASETRRGIATAIGMLAASADLRRAMGVAGHQRALSFTLSRRIEDVEALYDSVVAGAGGAYSRGQGGRDA